MLPQHCPSSLQSLFSRHAANVVIKDEFGEKNGTRADFGQAATRAGLMNGDK